MSQSAGFDPRWGHVWIVSHVFENGDILVVEKMWQEGMLVLVQLLELQTHGTIDISL